MELIIDIAWEGHWGQCLLGTSRSIANLESGLLDTPVDEATCYTEWMQSSLAERTTDRSRRHIFNRETRAQL